MVFGAHLRNFIDFFVDSRVVISGYLSLSFLLFLARAHLKFMARLYNFCKAKLCCIQNKDILGRGYAASYDNSCPELLHLFILHCLLFEHCSIHRISRSIQAFIYICKGLSCLLYYNLFHVIRLFFVFICLRHFLLWFRATVVTFWCGLSKNWKRDCPAQLKRLVLGYVASG